MEQGRSVPVNIVTPLHPLWPGELGEAAPASSDMGAGLEPVASEERRGNGAREPKIEKRGWGMSRA